MQAFQTLSAGRQMGMNSPQPIAVSEILAYCHMVGIHDTDERVAFLGCMQAMDAVFMRWDAKRREKDNRSRK